MVLQEMPGRGAQSNSVESAYPLKEYQSEEIVVAGSITNGTVRTGLKDTVASRGSPYRVLKAE